MKIIIVAILMVSILFAGCVENPFKSKDVAFDLKPAEITMKDNETSSVMIHVANNGKSIIHPVVSFGKNSSDTPYLNFSPESYDLGNLRPGEDSGYRIVDLNAHVAAGIETKYQVRAEVANNGTMVDSKDILITVTR
jgi:hypothetical protein